MIFIRKMALNFIFFRFFCSLSGFWAARPTIGKRKIFFYFNPEAVVGMLHGMKLCKLGGSFLLKWFHDVIILVHGNGQGCWHDMRLW